MKVEKLLEGLLGESTLKTMKIVAKRVDEVGTKISVFRKRMWTWLGITLAVVIFDIAFDFVYQSLWLEIVTLVAFIVAFWQVLRNGDLVEYGKGMMGAYIDLGTELMANEAMEGKGISIEVITEKRKEAVERMDKREAEKKTTKKRATKRSTPKKTATKKNVKRSSKKTK